jgi:hypothetical protein
MGKRKSADGEMSLRFIAHWEERVAKQEQLIADLKRKRRPAREAEAMLIVYKKSLHMLRNHAELMCSLMEPDPFYCSQPGSKQRKSVQSEQALKRIQDAT